MTRDDFYANLSRHNYICTVTGDFWSAAAVNAYLGPIVHGGRTLAASAWLDTHRAVMQLVWAPGWPQLIVDQMVIDGQWSTAPGCVCFNVYRKPAPGAPTLRLQRRVRSVERLTGGAPQVRGEA